MKAVFFETLLYQYKGRSLRFDKNRRLITVDVSVIILYLNDTKYKMINISHIL